MSTMAVASLGLATGFASTVWIIVGWTSLRLRRWLEVFSYGSLVVVNVTSTFILVSGLAGHPIELPQGMVTLILLPIIGLPPALQLKAWLVSRYLMGGTGE